MGLAKEWLAGGLANAVTSALLNPLDVTKTRLQVSESRVGMYCTLHRIFVNEGIRGLWMPGQL